MHEITRESIVFYAAVWTIAFLACLCRSVRDAAGVNFWNVLASSGMAGFLAFGCVGYVVGSSVDPGSRSHWYFLGLAALLGLVAKDPDKIAMVIISKALSAVRNTIPIQKDEEGKHDGSS